MGSALHCLLILVVSLNLWSYSSATTPHLRGPASFLETQDKLGDAARLGVLMGTAAKDSTTFIPGLGQIMSLAGGGMGGMSMGGGMGGMGGGMGGMGGGMGGMGGSMGGMGGSMGGMGGGMGGMGGGMGGMGGGMGGAMGGDLNRLLSFI